MNWINGKWHDFKMFLREMAVYWVRE